MLIGLNIEFVQNLRGIRKLKDCHDYVYCSLVISKSNSVIALVKAADPSTNCVADPPLVVLSLLNLVEFIVIF